MIAVFEIMNRLHGLYNIDEISELKNQNRIILFFYPLIFNIKFMCAVNALIGGIIYSKK